MPSISIHLQRFQRRLLNSTKVEDYFFAFIIPLIPIVFSLVIGIWKHTDINGYRFTGYEDAINQMSLIATLPVSLFLLRKVGNYLFGVNVDINHLDKVPLLTLFDNKKVQAEIHKNLRKAALSPIIPCVVLFFDVTFHFFDIGEVLKQYLLVFLGKEVTYSNIYYANLYLVRKNIDISTNFLFTFFVYLGQFIIFFIGLTLIFLFLFHNIFYLKLIYQRSRVTEDKIQCHIVLDFDDPDYRFGLNKINFIFNLQLIVLTFAGISILFSRWVVTQRIFFSVPEYFKFAELFSEKSIRFFLVNLFPEFGQYVIVLLWLFTFLVILLPTFIKFLPFFSRTVVTQGWSIKNYLREFIQPVDEVSKYPLITTEQINAVASKFAWNSFWPSGDDIARLIFYFVFFVCLVILFPLNLISTAVFAVMALFLGESFLNVYRWFLGHVDERLVKRRAEIKPGDTIIGVNMPNYDNSTHITSNVTNSPGAIATVGKYISDVTATVSQQLETSSASDEVKNLMKQLSEQIAAIDPSVNPAKVEQMGKDLKALGEEMAGAEPRRRWYELSLEGIKEAATAIGEVAKPVVDIVAKLLPLLIP